MSFSFISDEVGRSQIVLAGEPDYIFPLSIAPSSIEECLKKGNWLVVNMSVWKVNDIRAGSYAMEVVKRHRGLVKLGLRPFDYSNELKTWIPKDVSCGAIELVDVFVKDDNSVREVTIEGTQNTSPVWVLISEGDIFKVSYGLLAGKEIEELISEVLAHNR